MSVSGHPRGPVPAAAAGDELALAWALKDSCYEAWNTHPAEAVVAAERLEALRDGRPAAEDTVAALAFWTRGIAELASGRLSQGERALAEAARVFAALGDLQHRAETQVPMVMALSMQGRHDEALAVARACRATFEATGDERAAAKIELNTASLLTRQDRYAEAVPLYRSAAVRFARVRDLEHSVMADIGLANALTWSLDFDEAQRVNERARMRARSHGLAILEAQAGQAIGRIELLRGRYHAALREFTTSLERLEQAEAPPQRLLDAEMSLADAYAAVHLWPEALSLQQRVIERAAQLEAPTELADALLDRAAVRERLGDEAAALDDLARARATYEEQEADASAAWADLRAAALRLRRGEARAARRAAGEVAERLQALGIGPWALEARALEADAWMAEAAASPDGVDAAAALGQAEQGYRALLADAGTLAAAQFAGHRGLGALAWQRRDADTARRHLLTACRLVDDARAALPGDDLRLGLGAEIEPVHDLLVTIDLATGAPAARVIERIDDGRARALGLALQEAPATADAAWASQDAEQGEARTRLQWLRERRQQALADADAPLVADLAEAIARAEFDLLEAHRRHVAREGADRAAVGHGHADGDVGGHRPDPLRVDTLQDALAPDQALVLYHRLGGQLLAGVVTRDATALLPLSAQGLDERLESVRFQIDAWRFGAQRLAQHGERLLERARVHLHAAWRQVWAPLEPLLAGRHRVVVVPHGTLHYVPFAALHDGAGWLAERLELCLAPSASSWLAAAARPMPPLQRVLAVGVGSDALPHVQAEVQAVADAFGTGACGGSAQRLEEAAATAAAVRAAARGVDVLHLACHGEFRADNPAFSSIQLADGDLTLHDLQQWRLPVPMVALSACDTAMSRTAAGDDRVGLVRGFLASGTASVLASGWPVDDASTAGLMGALYRALVRGATPAAALREAQAGLARAGQHPFHWAAFSVHGRG
jgi:hypothetical protein